MVHYFGWYISENDDSVYTGNVPGKLKMRYVARKISEAGKELKIFSLADKRGKGFHKAQKAKTSFGADVLYSAGISSGGKVGRLLNGFLKKLQFVFYVLFKVKKDDTILLYHSVSYTKTLAGIKRLIDRKVVIEVEEIYGYSATEDRPWVDKEISYIKAMDSFIVVNAGIPAHIGIEDRKYVVSYGVCDLPPRRVEHFDDGKIHVVYAGTIETRKLGAITAVEAAQYLPDDYVTHIIGFGTQKNIEYMQQRIDEINKNSSGIKVQYDGYFTGDELDDFLFRCHIGLSSNVMRPNFANNSFPSKVITYMCHDLSVVLGYAKAFYDVPIAKNWSFYMEHEPEQIAKAITQTKILPKGHNIELIKELDSNLIHFIKEEC